MSVLIQLSRNDIDCLLRYLPPESRVRPKLANSDTVTGPAGLPIGPSNPFECEETEAFELLEVAKRRCSGVVQKIQEGIILSLA